MGKLLGPEIVDDVLTRLENGEGYGAIASVVGVGRHTVSRWARDAGYVIGHRRGVQPRAVIPSGVVSFAVTDSSSRGRRMGLYERTKIEVLRGQGLSNARIADEIGFSVTSVMREVRRHLNADGSYFARPAQRACDRDRARAKVRKLVERAELRAIVVDCLNKKFSPQQVALHLRREYPERSDLRVSHETVYQALYVQGRGSLRDELRVEKALRSGRAQRIPRSRLPKNRARSWLEGCLISTRPPDAADRAVPGHWEGDLVVGTKNQSAVITLVERTSRFVMMRRLPKTHDTESVIPVLIDAMKDLPAELRRTLTWDQGPEMAHHPKFTMATDMKVFFCDPHSPWQRGSNENTNGLIRDFFPKGTDFSKVTDEAVREAQDLLNIRPRATLHGLTPSMRLEQILGRALTT